MFTTKRQKDIMHTIYMGMGFGGNGVPLDNLINHYGHTAWWSLWRLERKGLVKPFRLVEDGHVRVRLTEQGCVEVELEYLSLLQKKVAL